MPDYKKLEDLIVYQKLCGLHTEAQGWTCSDSPSTRLGKPRPPEPSAGGRGLPSLAGNVSDAGMAHLKGYELQATYEDYRARYQECIRMLNGMERTLEKQLPESDHHWPDRAVREEAGDYCTCPPGFPETRTLPPELFPPSLKPRTLNPEP